MRRKLLGDPGSSRGARWPGRRRFQLVMGLVLTGLLLGLAGIVGSIFVAGGAGFWSASTGREIRLLCFGGAIAFGLAAAWIGRPLGLIPGIGLVGFVIYTWSHFA